MKYYKVLIALFVLSFSLFARDLSLSGMRERTALKKRERTLLSNFERSHEKSFLRNEIHRKELLGNSSAEVYAQLPDLTNGQNLNVYLFLLDKYGTVVSQQTIKSDSLVLFENLWPGEYTFYSYGSFYDGNTYRNLRAIHGTTDSLLSSATTKVIADNESVQFESLKYHYYETGSSVDEDSVLVQGIIKLPDGTPAKGVSAYFSSYSDGRYSSNHFVNTQDDGSFEFVITTTGDSVFGKWESINGPDNSSFASMWMNGNVLTDEPFLYDKSNGDTMNLELSLIQSVSATGRIIGEIQTKSKNATVTLSFYSKDGYEIAYKSDLLLKSGVEKDFTVNHLLPGDYFVVIDVQHFYEPYYYPGVKDFQNSQMITVGNNGVENIKINLGTIGSGEGSAGKSATIELTVKDEEGDVLQPRSDYGYGVRGTCSYDGGFTEGNMSYIEVSNAEKVFLKIEPRKSLFLQSYWYGGATQSDATPIIPQSEGQKISIEATIPYGGCIAGDVNAQSGSTIDSLSFAKNDNGYIEFHHEFFVPNSYCTRGSVWGHKGYRINGVTPEEQSIRTMVVSSFSRTQGFPNSQVEMYRGGKYNSTLTVEKMKTTDFNMVLPIVTGRLDTKVEVNPYIDPEVYVSLVDSSGYIVSLAYSDEDFIEKVSSETLPYKYNLLDTDPVILKNKYKDYNYNKYVTLFGVGASAYYLLAITFDGDNVYQNWYGKKEKVLADKFDWFMNFPYEKLDIPQGAKTISFDTDSTWIKDFNWDITPVSNMKTVTKSQFQVQQLGQKLQLQLPIEMNKVTAKILTPSGRLVKSVSIENSGLHSISISDVSKGVYFLKVESETQKFSEKVTIR